MRTHAKNRKWTKALERSVDIQRDIDSVPVITFEKHEIGKLVLASTVTAMAIMELCGVGQWGVPVGIAASTFVVLKEGL